MIPMRLRYAKLFRLGNVLIVFVQDCLEFVRLCGRGGGVTTADQPIVRFSDVFRLYASLRVIVVTMIVPYLYQSED